ncbi:hypothetical protein PR048_020802 [Dryococelus australis]|uniref:Failed axon connections n=1 Tax=Dryococelus australis TaxID=614101 RepID=A0ABQ9GWE6_9NEOP|nr:hypothetical protein PR048_020802 [Dryococelus australis]
MASEENSVPAEAKEQEATKVPEQQEKAPEDAATAQPPETPAAQTAPQPPKPAVHKQNFEQDVIYLYQFSRTPLLPSLSPFCLKVETWLRLAGLKYEFHHWERLFPAGGERSGAAQRASLQPRTGAETLLPLPRAALSKLQPAV